ncbi:hypothetical protein P171DRAFT_437126 [Karstenula rhodostoma CBS 690.94]|uniref:SP-RING-type domain-containing protein n=1 Tax=Karstenula rhodostoma CBS 690.94 TaxID=1392251 RepID=A0A9P4U6I3_9PLEO|nr:hypothetical protein P171DRAFT_437126 [Karstenula rhodostoma CBS 690.94]
MSSRHRQSGVRPTPSRSSIVPSQTPVRRPAVEEELPPYKKPSHPLNEHALTKLRALNGPSVTQLKDHNKKAGDRITNAAALVLDTLYERQAAVAKQRTKWDKNIGTESREQDEARLAELQAQVDEYSKKLEESMRAVIDNGVAAQRIEESLAWLQTHAPGRLQQEYATQRSQQQSQGASQRLSHSQRRRTQNRDDDDDEDMQDEHETQESMGPTPGPTPLDGSRPSLTGVSEMYTERVEREKRDYTSISYIGRYSKNKEYSTFKKMVHDAQYRDDRPLPNPEMWFTETGSPALGVTGHGEDHDDDDDDIVMERATISIKCPLTFLPYKDPYTSLKCPHTFERVAIMEMIRKSNVRVGGGSASSGEKAVKCPVTGCDQMLRANDLNHDPVLARRIKRLQEDKAREAEQSDAEEERQVSVSQQPTPSAQPRIKVSSSSRLQVPSIQELPRSSIVDDLGSSGDEDE